MLYTLGYTFIYCVIGVSVTHSCLEFEDEEEEGLASEDLILILLFAALWPLVVTGRLLGWTHRMFDRMSGGDNG